MVPCYWQGPYGDTPGRPDGSKHRPGSVVDRSNTRHRRPVVTRVRPRPETARFIITVVACRQAAPLLEVAEVTLDDDVASLVGLCVEGGRPTAAGTASAPMSFLIVGFRDHRGDTAVAKMPADRTKGVGLVCADSVRPSPRSADRATHPKTGHQGPEHRGVTCLPRGQHHHHRRPVPIDQREDLGRQPAARPADRVVRRLRERIGWIGVTRPSPL